MIGNVSTKPVTPQPPVLETKPKSKPAAFWDKDLAERNRIISEKLPSNFNKWA